jgi:anti-sigma B factor antagonist
MGNLFWQKGGIIMYIGEPYESRRVNMVSVVDLRGSINLNQGTAVKFRETVKTLLDEGRNNIVLDFSKVTYIDSTGIGHLIRASIRARSQGGQLKLVGVSKKIRDLLHIIFLDTVVEIFENVEQACASFDKEDP